MSPRARTRAAIVIVIGAIGLFFAARSRAHARRHAFTPTGPTTELRVPRVVGDITLDGDTDDSGWQGPTARTGALLDDVGGEARPYSQARFAWNAGYLYVELYAADVDIRATHETPDGPVWNGDAFQLVFDDGATERAFDVSALGTLTDGIRASASRTPAGAPRPFDWRWSSGAHVSHEVDGTPNVPGDEDEEWVIEMAIPFEALGIEGVPGERIGASVRRCDTSPAGVQTCATWGRGESRGVLVID